MYEGFQKRFGGGFPQTGMWGEGWDTSARNGSGLPLELDPKLRRRGVGG